jgi:predicted chitinase
MLTQRLAIATAALVCLVRAADAQALTTDAAAAPKPSDLVGCESISKFSPRARADIVCEIAKNWMSADSAGINTVLRIQHFFSQIATETGGMTGLSENLDYSAERIFRSLTSALTRLMPRRWHIIPRTLRTMSTTAGLATPPPAMMDGPTAEAA